MQRLLRHRATATYLLVWVHATAGQAEPTHAPEPQHLAQAFGRLVADAVPEVYDKREDWDRQKNITVGLKTEGKGLRTKIRRRKKPVNHGVWKHYRVRLDEPEQNLQVRVENLRSIDPGRVGFTLRAAAKLDAWARAKVYHYGVHLIALEMVGEMHVDLRIDCEVGIAVKTIDNSPGIAIDPQVTDAALQFSHFRLQRVSNAKGPLVRELGDAMQKAIQRDLQGPKLTQKLNRAIEKKKDRLQLTWRDLLQSDWSPLASFATPPKLN